MADSGTLRGIHFGYVSARMLIAVVLPLTLSLFVIRGLTPGAVKG